MKAAFVTGANRGLGYGFVEVLLARGWRVFGGVRTIIPSLPDIKNLTWVPLDLSDDVSMVRAVAQVSAQTDVLDLLINNAGINKDTATNQHKEKVSLLRHLERTALMRMFDINAIAPILILQKFLQLLTRDPAYVINISSRRASFQDEFDKSHANYGYRASKVALNMMTRASVHDLPENIRTFAVHPGSVRSDMNPHGVDDATTQAEQILAVCEMWNNDWNGKFMHYNGTPYPL